MQQSNSHKGGLQQAGRHRCKNSYVDDSKRWLQVKCVRPFPEKQRRHTARKKRVWRRELSAMYYLCIASLPLSVMSLSQSVCSDLTGFFKDCRGILTQNHSSKCTQGPELLRLRILLSQLLRFLINKMNWTGKGP